MPIIEKAHISDGYEAHQMPSAEEALILNKAVLIDQKPRVSICPGCLPFGLYSHFTLKPVNIQ
jgi:hypothetical protein